MPISPPTDEIGAVNPGGTGTGPLSGNGRSPGWDRLFDDRETNPKLAWPKSIGIYSEMLRGDAQVKALASAVTLPQRRRVYAIDPNGARPEITEHVAADLGLPIAQRDAPPRLIGGFDWHRHLFHVLLAPFYGHYFFEQSGAIEDDGRWHLRKLAPRPPRTISEINVERDGGLRSIRQNTGINPPPIPVERLVAYVWEQEAGDWFGDSMLRSVYKHWLRKDDLLRVDVQKHRRNGMGVPNVVAPEGASPRDRQDLAAAAQRYRAGETAGVAWPHGAQFTLEGVRGTLPDTIASIRYDDEQMARRFLAMFMQLGQTETGSRALGESFVDFFALAEDAMAAWICDVTTRHVIRDHAVWNYDVDPLREPVPLLISTRPGDPAQDAAPLAESIRNGTIAVDEEVAEAVQTSLARRSGTRRPFRHAHTALSVGDRELRRERYPHEVAAATDFETAEIVYVSAAEELQAVLVRVRSGQIADLVAQIRDADGDLGALARIRAAPGGADDIAAVLLRAAGQGANGATAEAAEQGLDVDAPGIDTEAIEARAAATAQTLADDVSTIAARAAVRLHGPSSPTGRTLADDVETYLDSLKWQTATNEARGAVQGAFNGGRFTGMREASSAAETTRIYHSALLDTNTCTPCTDQDGEEYVDLQDAEAAFAGSGGYAFCDGGPLCRCTPVAIYNESEASVE